VIIEVPIGGEPIKYEMNKAAGALFVDRFLYTPMRYPGNYGFVPHTLSDDGDPIDVLVANSRPIAPGAVINVRPIGVLKMDDEGGGDEKIIAVPMPKLTMRYAAWACNECQKCRFQTRLYPPHGLSGRSIRTEKHRLFGILTGDRHPAAPKALRRDARHAQLARSLSGLDAAAGRSLRI
jgi:hypothetical protein